MGYVKRRLVRLEDETRLLRWRLRQQSMGCFLERSTWTNCSAKPRGSYGTTLG